MNFTLKIFFTFSVSYRNFIRNLTGTHRHSLWLTLFTLTLSVVHFLVIHMLQSFLFRYTNVFSFYVTWFEIHLIPRFHCLVSNKIELNINQLPLATTIICHCRYIRNLWIKNTFLNKRINNGIVKKKWTIVKVFLFCSNSIHK